jgi:hypothetical protein
MKQIMYKNLLTIIMLLVSTMAFSQNIAVQSFAPDESDQSARITNKRTDANNKDCAIVKIETPLRLQDINFDPGMVGIAHSEQKTGEIWVWLSPGAQRLTIIHKDLGSIRNYEFGEPLKEATVYIMKLKSGTTTTVINENVALQYFVVNCSIEGATIKIDGNPSEAFNNGTFQKLLSYGKHQYTIEAPTYLPLSEQIEIKPSEKTYRTPQLQPAYAAITLTGAGDIYVNDEHKGADTWSGRLMPGSYKVEVKKISHRTSVAAIEVKAGEDKTIPLQAPTPIYGSLNISANAEAAILIDGVKQKETTPAIIQNVLIGKHGIELQAGGQSEKQSVEVTEGKITELKAALQAGENKKTDNLLAQEDDVLIYSGSASYSGKSGKLYLFPDKLQFQSKKSNFTIEITKIAKVAVGFGKLAITTTEGKTEEFVVNKSKVWKTEIEKLITAEENKVAAVASVEPDKEKTFGILSDTSSIEKDNGKQLKIKQPVKSKFFIEYVFSKAAPLGITFGGYKQWGGYGRLKLNPKGFDTTEEADLSILLYEDKRYSRFALTGGVMWRVFNVCYLYGGGGYGSYGVAYKVNDDKGSYFRPDATYQKGVELEGGVMVKFKWFSVSTSYCTILSGSPQRFSDINLGIGINF